MKKYFLLLLLLMAASFSSFSQELSYGLKGGLNYAMGGEIEGGSSGLGYWAGTAEGEGALGFHGGLFFQVNFGKIFIRPEVVYSSLKQEFDIPLPKTPTGYTVETITVPLLLGYNVYGPLDIYAGPVYSHILDAMIENEEYKDPIDLQNFPVNAQVGAKVELGRFGLDVRYEHSLSTAQPQPLNFDNGSSGGSSGFANLARFNDSRLNQIIVSLIFKIGGPGLNERKSRACY